tara:strand:- start:407 stop:541 length:135 start_codon:yes stop_codon:yes gene_type:complete
VRECILKIKKNGRDYGEKQYKDFDMYFKFNEKFLKDYYNNKEVK